MTRPLQFNLAILCAATALAIASAGCIAPAVVSSVDPEVAELLAAPPPGIVKLVVEQIVLEPPNEFAVERQNEPVQGRRAVPLIAARPLPAPQFPHPVEPVAPPAEPPPPPLVQVPPFVQQFPVLLSPPFVEQSIVVTPLPQH